ncbi:MAG: DUF2334 domain-containing protein [Lachnospiraceae bacterium]|nr:DUF2334 domain-containing protein [Lachnospiraceae bacterium]
MRKIVIRIDDVCPEMDWTKMERFERLLDEYSIKPLIGVVPFNHDRQLMAPDESRNPDFADEAAYAAWLKKKQEAGWMIALHGCFHVYTTKNGGLFPLNVFSEFAGVPYKRQKRMIGRGRDKLKELGIRCNIFMAPGHSYDEDTLKALRSCGFKYVTDGYGHKPYMYKGLKFLPISMLRSRELKADRGITTFVVHTWEMEESDFTEYEKLFSEQRERFGDYEEMLGAEAGGKNAVTILPERIAARAKRTLGKLVK